MFLKFLVVVPSGLLATILAQVVFDLNSYRCLDGRWATLPHVQCRWSHTNLRTHGLESRAPALSVSGPLPGKAATGACAENSCDFKSHSVGSDSQASMRQDLLPGNATTRAIPLGYTPTCRCMERSHALLSLMCQGLSQAKLPLVLVRSTAVT